MPITSKALPILLFVLSIIDPKNISVTPSNNFETIISVPTIPESIPIVSVRYIIKNDDKNAYTTFPAISPEPYPTLLYHFKYVFFPIVYYLPLFFTCQTDIFNPHCLPTCKPALSLLKKHGLPNNVKIRVSS